MVTSAAIYYQTEKEELYKYYQGKLFSYKGYL